MSGFLGDDHRALQARFGTEKLSKMIEDVAVKDRVGGADKAFIESRDMFFLASVSADGQPTASYKGGDPGFVRVLDEHTVVFPSYDGNGMYYSMGNIANNAKLGLLFIDFETPHRLRLEGSAALDDDPALLASYPEAQLLVRIAVARVWVNCPRYVHRYQRIEASRYVPRQGQPAPLAAWKRIDEMQAALPARDRDQVEAAGGLISGQEYRDKLLKGET
ncbi:MAG: pyridoxamine 5'-phosphate oxidase family protein [Alphaproteobacteria bacterium]|jgi:hypothetical protein|nr:pyridoxamine 5'-phosphate oxidase family protein [Alphaproteobacteria bacterium]MDP6832939.1 pyridoxamine 5'-phosphate oxidase family protein [Alphaproteobacteria bacterium]MDP6874751.1 pyridoxamine 5'-phosphate oxidase family protein [Alphaproteobacteria bacterium]